MKLLQVLTMSLCMALIGIAGAAMTSSGAIAEDTLLAQASGKATLRSIPATKGKLVTPALGLKAKGGGGSAATCCKNWNTSTGGTNCGEYDVCPSGWFEVTCGSDGCW